MSLHAYEWSEYLLMITVRSAGSVMGFLVADMSQDEFFEYWAETYRREIIDFQVVHLTAGSFDTLRAIWPADRVLEGRD